MIERALVACPTCGHKLQPQHGVLPAHPDLRALRGRSSTLSSVAPRCAGSLQKVGAP